MCLTQRWGNNTEVEKAAMPRDTQNETTIFNLTTMLGAARMPVERSDRRIAHFREARRDDCNISCDVTIVLRSGMNYDSGTAELSNFSPNGALLTDLRLQRSSLPLAPFKLTLRLRGKDYDGIRIEATPIRLPETGFSLGVRFDDLAVELG